MNLSQSEVDFMCRPTCENYLGKLFWKLAVSSICCFVSVCVCVLPPPYFTGGYDYAFGGLDSTGLVIGLDIKGLF